MVRFAERWEGNCLVIALLAILEQRIAVVQHISSSRGEVNVLLEFGHNLGEVCFVKIPGHDESSSQVPVLLLAEYLLQLGFSNVCAGLWWNIDRCNNYRCELSGQVKGPAHDGQMLQAGLGESDNVLWVTPLVVCHEADSTTFGLTRLLCSVCTDNREGPSWCDRIVWNKGS